MLLFNEITWKISVLGEQVLLLETAKDIPIEKIHASTYLLIEELSGELVDIVPAYHSIAVFTELTQDQLYKKLKKIKGEKIVPTVQEEVIELPIFYELGMDLNRVAAHSKLTVDQVIDVHLSRTYRSLFIGFTPGFIYADGLDDRLACPRLETPRNLLPGGSVGIAGMQTGIYSLASPGGWNIIGRTPKKIFDAEKKSPMLIEVGARYRFFRISKEEFETWES